MKLNRKNSQLSIDYSLAYRNWHHLSRVYEETFNLPNDTLERCEHGLSHDKLEDIPDNGNKLSDEYI